VWYYKSGGKKFLKKGGKEEWQKSQSCIDVRVVGSSPKEQFRNALDVAERSLLMLPGKNSSGTES
jgi:hypothetical protein